MVSTLEALERYPVPPSTAKLMPSAVSSHPSCNAVSRPVPFGGRKAESEGRCAALAPRPPLSDAATSREAMPHRDCTTDRLKRH